MMKNFLADAATNLPFVKHLNLEVDQLRSKLRDFQKLLDIYQLGWPPGHFYSPIPSLEEVRSRENKIFGEIPREIPGIDLREAEQIELFNQLSAYYAEQPFQDTKQENIRYFFANPNYSYGESIVLYSLIRHIKPKRIIEVGSGYSSCVSLDTNELFFDNTIQCTFIEPYPELLYSLIKESDRERIRVIPSKLQEVDLSVFSSLVADDILLIDSTHVTKVDSDVNHLLFRIIPHIASGVYIHFHDICYPFEYPKEWVYQGRAWNEAYILRAFLQYNCSYEISLFNSFLGHFYRDILLRNMPLCAKNPGSSIWLKKV
jgi:hypothetical protein